jgi:hypothetical protein
LGPVRSSVRRERLGGEVDVHHQPAEVLATEERLEGVLGAVGGEAAGP